MKQMTNLCRAFVFDLLLLLPCLLSLWQNSVSEQGASSHYSTVQL